MPTPEDAAAAASASSLPRIVLPPTSDSHRLSVAPMLDCTDAHFRAVCRSFSRRTHLWTEMIHQDAVIHSHASRPEMLGHDASEHPLTVQLGGSSPGRLARAAEICDAAYGYDEVNLNAGCPSAKVTSKSDAEKCFGAVLMRDPELVGECLRRMREAVDVPVTLKHRLGVRTRGAGGGGGGRRRHLHRHQHQSRSASERPSASDDDAADAADAEDNYAYVSDFVQRVHELSGVTHFIVHARAAVLGGLSPAANRSIPPLRHREVHALASDFPKLGFSLNGGVETVDDAVRHLSSGKLKGVMLGRAVYRDPTILHDVDARVYGDESGGVGVDPTLAKSRGDALTRFAAYGDHVLRERWATHPRAGINLTRALFKACAGVVHGTRGGKEFKRLAEAECLGVKQGGGLKDAGGSPSRFGEMMARCASAVHEEDLRAPLRRGGGAVVKTWEANAAEGDDARFGDR